MHIAQINRIPFYKHVMGLLHPNDPANAPEEDPRSVIRTDLEESGNYRPNAAENFIEAIECSDEKLVAEAIDKAFAGDALPLCMLVAGYWDTQLDVQTEYVLRRNSRIFS